MSDMAGWGGDDPAKADPTEVRAVTEKDLLHSLLGELRTANAHLQTIKVVLVVTLIVVPLVFWVVVALTTSDSGSGSGF